MDMNLERRKRSELEDYLWQAKGYGYEPRGKPKNNAERISTIQMFRRRFWNDQQAKDAPKVAATPARSDAPKPRRASKFSGITASECNAFLRSLPPLEPL